jgi:CheY-like chemotaxis protein
MSKMILVVDDDPDYLTQMRLQLERAGYGVHTAGSVEEGETWLADHQADLAIVDLMMENSDSGFSLCHRIKQQQPELPIVMVTGVAAESGMRFDSDAVGNGSWIKADAVLNKPVRFEQLEREMTRLIKA